MRAINYVAMNISGLSSKRVFIIANFELAKPKVRHLVLDFTV
jgi:hypothetical protein